MFEQFDHILHLIVGTNPVEQLTCMQMIARGILIYLFGILLVRLHERFFGLKTTHDILLRITIA
ncbi:MAG: hypothetical protein P4L31_08800, partial [Candidatus Babeliales bacterium]|nr:hypothetical protein [Candidatus Babeliales bacterium]